MADRDDVEMLTHELNNAHIDTSNLTQESIVNNLRKKYPNGFTLAGLVADGLLSSNAIVQTKMIPMLTSIESTHDALAEADPMDSDRCFEEWEEPLLCEIGSLVDNTQLPIDQTALVETLMRLYVNYKLSIKGPDFSTDKWVFSSAASSSANMEIEIQVGATVN